MFSRRSLIVPKALFFLALALVLPSAAPAPAPVTFTDFANAFDAFAERTEDMPTAERVKAFRATFDRIAPGLYASADQARLERRIVKALDEFPAIRPAYRHVERTFPKALRIAVRRFRRVFPDFSPPLPIYLTHQLGERDGGSDYVNGRKVMLFGADVIARIHNDDSLQPFLEHELFHLEHARHFVDCDQLWCPLWQEGLATYAAAAMTPGASDHQLLLDQPEPIRAPIDARWGEALCWIAARFDSAAAADSGAAFSAGAAASGLPPRFGYYVGLRVAMEAARTRQLPALARLDDAEARPIVAKALGRLIGEAHARCPAPALRGRITHGASRSA